MPLAITDQPVDAPTPRTTNPRTRFKAQIAQIAASIRRFGFTNPNTKCPSAFLLPTPSP